MIRQFFKDSFTYGLAGILSRGIQILLIPIYTRVFAPQEYGIIDWLTVIAALINLTVALEISQGVARYISEADTKYDKSAYASTSVLFTLAAYGLFAILCISFSSELALAVIGSEEYTYVIIAAVAAIALNGVYVLLQDLLRWQFKPFEYAVTSIVFSITAASVSIYLVLVPKLGISGIYYGQIAGAIVGMALSWFYSRDIFTLKFDRKRCKTMLVYSIPLVPSSMAVFANLYIDRIAIKEISGLSDLGIYGVGFRFASIMSLLLMGFQATITPLIFKNHKNPETPDNIARIFLYYLAITGSLIIFLSLFSSELLRVFATSEYYIAWSVIPVLAVALLVANSYIFSPGLFLAKKTKTIAFITVLCAIANFALNIVLIPVLGILGAAIASLLSATLLFALYISNSQKLYRVPYNWRKLGVFIAMAVIAVVVGYLINAQILQFLDIIIIKTIITLVLVVSLSWLMLGKKELEAALYWVREKQSKSEIVK